VLYPSSYGAWPEDIDWVIGPILDPARWCVVLVSQFGNGRSSSPSNSALGLAETGWVVRHGDNLRAQRRLLEEVFGVESPALIYGWSMGAQQAYHWAVLEPERTQRICCLCGTARTTPHNRCSCSACARPSPPTPTGTDTASPAGRSRGCAASPSSTPAGPPARPSTARVRHRALGYSSVEDYVERAWLPAYRRHDPRDLIAMLDTWLANDVASEAGLADDLAAALGRIRARALVIAASSDLYFPPEDCAAEAAAIPSARFERLESPLGHRAGNPREAPAERASIRHWLDQLCANATISPTVSP
jgi:homoserine O-acetyltransferase